MVQQVPPTNRKPRHDEWTLTKMAAFLRELAATQSVSAAAKGVGMSRQSAYKLRTRLVGTKFAAEWDEAVADARLAIPRGPMGAPSICPLCGGAPRRALGWGR